MLERVWFEPSQEILRDRVKLDCKEYGLSRTKIGPCRIVGFGRKCDVQALGGRRQQQAAAIMTGTEGREQE